jgi:hypothetical protein
MLLGLLYVVLDGALEVLIRNTLDRDRYAADAEVTGDERLAAFFREAQAMQTQLAERAKELLGILESPPEFGPPPGNVPPGAEVSADVPAGDLRREQGPEYRPKATRWRAPRRRTYPRTYGGAPRLTPRSLRRRRPSRPTSLPRRTRSEHRGRSHHRGKSCPKGAERRLRHRPPRARRTTGGRGEAREAYAVV